MPLSTIFQLYCGGTQEVTGGVLPTFTSKSDFKHKHCVSTVVLHCWLCQTLLYNIREY